MVKKSIQHVKKCQNTKTRIIDSYFTPERKSRNRWFSGAFWGYKMGTLVRNGLNLQNFDFIKRFTLKPKA